MRIKEEQTQCTENYQDSKHLENNDIVYCTKPPLILINTEFDYLIQSSNKAYSQIQYSNQRRLCTISDVIIFKVL